MSVADRSAPTPLRRHIHRQAAGAPDIAGYYRQTLDDYQVWSRAGYMHFGLWQPWINPLNRRRMLEAMNDLVFRELRLENRRPMTIGDLGCGTGAVSHYGSRRFPTHQWKAFTISPEQVAWGRAQLTEAVRNRVIIHAGDYAALPLDNASLDGAFFLESLCHADDVGGVLSEAARVLRPGARLVVVDGRMRHEPTNTPRYARRLAAAAARNWALPRFISVTEFENGVAQAGLRIESKSELGWQIAPCVAHSPILVAWHTLKLVATGRWSAWRRRHMIGCILGVLLGLLRNQFGYYAYTLVKP